MAPTQRGKSTVVEERILPSQTETEMLKYVKSIALQSIAFSHDHPCTLPVFVVKTKPATTFRRRKGGMADRSDRSFPTGD